MRSVDVCWYVSWNPRVRYVHTYIHACIHVLLADTVCTLMSGSKAVTQSRHTCVCQTEATHSFCSFQHTQDMPSLHKQVRHTQITADTERSTLQAYTILVFAVDAVVTKGGYQCHMNNLLYSTPNTLLLCAVREGVTSTTWTSASSRGAVKSPNR